MRCGRYERWIALDAGGDLSSADRAKLAAHLAECPSCREFADAMTEARSEWMALAEPEIDEADLAAVRRGVRARVVREQTRPWFAWRWAAGAMALATVVGVVWMGIGLRVRSSVQPAMVRRPESRVAQGLKPQSSLAGVSARLKPCPDTNHPDVECEEGDERQVALRIPQSAERGRLESGVAQGLKPEPSLAGGSARLKSCPDTNQPDVECEEPQEGPGGRSAPAALSARVKPCPNPDLGCEEPQKGPGEGTAVAVQAGAAKPCPSPDLGCEDAPGKPRRTAKSPTVATNKRPEPLERPGAGAPQQPSNVVAVSSDVVRIQTPDPNVVVYWVLENTGDE